MLDLIASWFGIFGQPQPNLQPLTVFAWEKTAIFELPKIIQDDLTADIVASYLQNLERQGIEPSKQGIWVQSDWATPVSKQGKIPLPAASLTKIAITLAALHKWGARHQFTTKIYSTGEIARGILTGDLIIEGSGDPLFVWEEAIALGNALQELGITQVQGDILVTDKFYMNFKDRSTEAATLLKQALDRQLWQGEITRQYLQMPTGTKQPNISISGKIQTVDKVASDAQLLVRHQSLPLAEILRQMNIYSNNKMAQMLADLAGGAAQIAQTSAEISNFPPEEIQLVNGSGLGEENRLSPRAVSQMLMAIDRLLKKHSLSSADLFPTAGRDLVGTVQNRGLPKGTTVKTGTLDYVSALAGVIPTGDRGNVYFAMINYGRQVDYFRQQQDNLLNELVQNWQLKPNSFNSLENWYLGDPERNYFSSNNE